MTLDLALLAASEWGRISTESVFPLVATVIIRYIFVRFIVRGIWAVRLYDQLGREMRNADRL